MLTEADEICAAHQLRESHPPIVESLALALERSGDMAAALAAHRRFHSLQMQINSETAEREARALVLEAPMTGVLDIAAENAPRYVPMGFLMRDTFLSRDYIGSVMAARPQPSPHASDQGGLRR